MSTRLLFNLISFLDLVFTSKAFYIFVLAVVSWGVAFLLGYGAWIVLREVVQVLEDILRVILQIP